MNGRRLPTFSALPPDARVIWAKSGEATGHGLLAHLLDVAAVVEALLAREPCSTGRMLARALGLDLSQVPRWVAAISGLHDFGKAIPGFQAKWPQGRLADERQGLPFRDRPMARSNHSLATAALLTKSLQRLTGLAQRWCANVVQAVSAHHGYHFSTFQVEAGAPRSEEPCWEAAREAILLAYWEVLAPRGVPTARELLLPMVNWLAGLTSAADWIASNPLWFPLGERSDDLTAYHRDAVRLGGEALDRIGWPAYRPLLDDASEPLNAMLGRIVQKPDLDARPLQRVGDELLRSAQGPSLFLVEAPMGEGKTELAFLAHLRLQAANEHRGLYVAMPTQATGNALFRRAQTFLTAFSTGPLDVQLVHGGAAMNSDLAALHDIDHSRGETLAASLWFGQRRRPLLSPYGVGTVDQALYAVLNVKHHFVRMWGLSNRVVVLDEVHAYDTYTSGLIVTLVRWLRALECSVVLMSATLPRARRQELLAAWGVEESTVELPYPRLMLADAHGARGEHVGARPLPAIELSGMDSDPTAMAEAAFAAVSQGGCGAVIINTVQRAQSIYRALKARLAATGHDGVDLLLFHARFPADERGALEDRVRAAFGPDVPRPTQALLVATQVVEASLDLDFDFMFSDLAPADLLLQRAGRLHRHAREGRPAAHATPRLRVAGLLPDRIPEMKATGWGFVYDPHILARTWALLTRETVLRLPADIDRLVQTVYDLTHELPADLQDAARDMIEVGTYGEHLAKVKTQQVLAQSAALHPDREPQDAYDRQPIARTEDDVGVEPEKMTRLGPDSVTLVPVVVGVDGRWHVTPGDVGFAPDERLGDETARALYNRQLKSSRAGAVRYFRSMPLPRSFEGHALLRHMHPLCLVDGRAPEPRLKMSLDPELGLVFEEREGEATPPLPGTPAHAGIGQ